MNSTALVVGASGGLGAALVQQLSLDYQVIAVSSGKRPENFPGEHWLSTDHSEESIIRICQRLSVLRVQIERVCICNGVLHSGEQMPEKRLEDVSGDYLARLYQSNAIVPMLWIKNLVPLLQPQDCRLAVFSARVGSIGDNRLGGWYAYRASKAALNMLMQTAAIEYARRAKGVKLIAFHPGTTDTALSKPFQARVPEGKLFKPADVASRLVEIMDEQQADGQLSYLDWAGKPIPW